MSDIEHKTEQLLLQPIHDLGYEIYDIEYVKEVKDYYLRIYIDHENGISIEDCEKVSNMVSDLLDKNDFIEEQYFLEISSPGIERVLRKEKHLETYLGKEIQLNFFRPIDKTKTMIGTLNRFNDDEIEILLREEIKIIKRKEISKIKAAYNW